jgi:hypothetical protein
MTRYTKELLLKQKKSEKMIGWLKSAKYSKVMLQLINKHMGKLHISDQGIELKTD